MAYEHQTQRCRLHLIDERCHPFVPDRVANKLDVLVTVLEAGRSSGGYFSQEDGFKERKNPQSKSGM
jgi:hypothetical protein